MGGGGRDKESVMNNKQAAFLNTSLKEGGYLNNVCASPLSLICMSTLTTKRRAGEWDEDGSTKTER